MKKNVGRTDALLRFLVALALVASAASGSVTGIWAIVAYAIAIVFAATAYFGTCPIYTLFGINTCPVKPADK